MCTLLDTLLDAHTQKTEKPLSHDPDREELCLDQFSCTKTCFCRWWDAAELSVADLCWRANISPGDESGWVSDRSAPPRLVNAFCASSILMSEWTSERRAHSSSLWRRYVTAPVWERFLIFLFGNERRGKRKQRLNLFCSWGHEIQNLMKEQVWQAALARSACRNRMGAPSITAPLQGSRTPGVWMPPRLFAASWQLVVALNCELHSAFRSRAGRTEISGSCAQRGKLWVKTSNLSFGPINPA